MAESFACASPTVADESAVAAVSRASDILKCKQRSLLLSPRSPERQFEQNTRSAPIVRQQQQQQASPVTAMPEAAAAHCHQKMALCCADKDKQGALPADDEQSRQPMQAPVSLTPAGCEGPTSCAAAPELLTFDTIRQADVENTAAAVATVTEAASELMSIKSSQCSQGNTHPITSHPPDNKKSPKVQQRQQQQQPKAGSSPEGCQGTGSPMELERLAALFLEGDAIAALKHTSRIALCEALKSPGHYVQQMSQLDPQARSHFTFRCITSHQCSSPRATAVLVWLQSVGKADCSAHVHSLPVVSRLLATATCG